MNNRAKYEMIKAVRELEPSTDLNIYGTTTAQPRKILPNNYIDTTLEGALLKPARDIQSPNPKFKQQ